MRASANYRRVVAGNLLCKFHLETTGVTARTRVLPVRVPSVAEVAP
jgi:xanthine dehydrogenase iron-sulfur cluster and FAD-binding subunit A